MDVRCLCIPSMQLRSLFALVSRPAKPKERTARRLSKLRAAGLVPIVLLVPALLSARQLPRDQPLPPFENTTRVRAYEAGADIEFGRSVSYDGTRIAVGAPDDDEGAVRIYTRSGSEGRWELETRIPFPEEALGFVGFGTAIAIEGDTVAIGAPGVLNEDIRVRGAVYVYERTDGQWQQSARLQRFKLPPDVPPLDVYPFERFGATLDLDGDVLVVGAPGVGRIFQEPTGDVRLFRRVAGVWDDGVQLGEGADGPVEVRYGAQVRIDSGRVVVGSNRIGSDGSSGFPIDVYDVVGGSRTRSARIPRPDNESGLFFGNTIAVSGDWILATSEGPQGSFLYAFGRSSSGWTLSQAIELEPTPFGALIDVNGNTAVAAEISSRRVGSTSVPGAVHLRRLTLNDGTWSFASESPIAPMEQFGANSMILGDDGFLAVGSVDSRANSGSVFTFDDATSGSPTASQELSEKPDLALRVGASVSIAGDVAVAGGDSDIEDIAVVFELGESGWSEGIALDAGELPDDAEFGRAAHVLASGAVLVGAPGADRVLVFERSSDGWSETATITASTGEAADRLGCSFASDEGLIAVGACAAAGDVESSGVVYIFERDNNGGFSQRQRIAPRESNGAVENIRFGRSLHLDGQRLLVGAPGSAESSPYGGTAWLYTADSSADFGFTTVLTDPEGSAGDEFGFAVALRDDRALIGAPSYDLDGNIRDAEQGVPALDGQSAGLAFFFVEDAAGSWSLESVIFGGSPFRGLGRSVVLLEDRAFVGQDDIGPNNRSIGKAYELVFEDDTWQITQILSRENSSTTSAFGQSLAFDQDILLLGAPGAFNGGGAIYSFGARSPGGGGGSGGDNGGGGGHGDGGSGGGGSSGSDSSDDGGCASIPGAGFWLIVGGCYRRRQSLRRIAN